MYLKTVSSCPLGLDGPEGFRGDAGLDDLGIAGQDGDVRRHFGVVIRIRRRCGFAENAVVDHDVRRELAPERFHS